MQPVKQKHNKKDRLNSEQKKLQRPCPVTQLASDGDFSNCFSSSGERATLSDPNDEKLLGLGTPTSLLLAAAVVVVVLVVLVALTLALLFSRIANRVRVYVGTGAR